MGVTLWTLRRRPKSLHCQLPCSLSAFNDFVPSLLLVQSLQYPQPQQKLLLTEAAYCVPNGECAGMLSFLH